MSQIEKENCQLVMATLNHFDSPVSLAKIVNHMSTDQKVSSLSYLTSESN